MHVDQVELVSEARDTELRSHHARALEAQTLKAEAERLAKVQQGAVCVLQGELDASHAQCTVLRTKLAQAAQSAVQVISANLSAVITNEEFLKSGIGLFLRNSSRHYFTPVRNDIKYGVAQGMGGSLMIMIGGPMCTQKHRSTMLSTA